MSAELNRSAVAESRLQFEERRCGVGQESNRERRRKRTREEWPKAQDWRPWTGDRGPPTPYAARRQSTTSSCRSPLRADASVPMWSAKGTASTLKPAPRRRSK
jgi:hypothetical protein